MALNIQPFYIADEEEYIDMDVCSFSSFLCHSSSSPTSCDPRDNFEFSLERQPTTSPADELFYKGKLLPLHLPPRLEMVEKLLQNSNSNHTHTNNTTLLTTYDRDFFSTPLATTTTTTPTTTTPFLSCNASPSESCQVSRELNPEEYYYMFDHCPKDIDHAVSGSIVGETHKKSWAKKLKQSSIGSKLRASRAYIKSLFGKSGCSDEHHGSASAKIADEGSAVSKPRESNLNKSFFIKPEKKLHPSGQIENIDQKIKIVEDGGKRHRRSFSVGIKRHSTTTTNNNNNKPASTILCCSEKTTNRFQEWQLLKRCSSTASSEIENSIQGAIAHCKQSHQQLFPKRISVCENM